MFNNTKNDSVNVIIRLYIEIVVLQGKHNINPRLKKKNILQNIESHPASNPGLLVYSPTLYELS